MSNIGEINFEVTLSYMFVKNYSCMSHTDRYARKN